MDDEYELLEDRLCLPGFSPEFFPCPLLARLTTFSELEKAASSILFLLLEDLLAEVVPGEGLSAPGEGLLPPGEGLLAPGEDLLDLENELVRLLSESSLEDTL